LHNNIITVSIGGAHALISTTKMALTISNKTTALLKAYFTPQPAEFAR
jgi:hypothetical protein